LLAAPRAVPAVEAMYDHGLLTLLIGIAPRPGLFRRLVEIEGTHGLEPEPMLRLAALAVEVAEDAERLFARLKLSNAERERLMRAAIADRHGLTPPASLAAAKTLIYRHGAEAYRDLVLIAWTRSLGATPTDAEWTAKLKLSDSWRVPKFTLTGKDVTALGIAPGPRVGELLRRVEDWWIAAGFPDDRKLLMSQLEAAARTD
jgi:poly(A) polymerase